MPADTVWTIKAALDWTVDYLADRDDEHPRRSAEWLLSAATGLSRVELYAYHDRPLSPEERTTLREGVKRRAAGEPLQYVTGEVAFRHIVVKVRPGVLIPRPETEVLVDAGLPAVDSAIAERGEALVVDLCTGSGCIALAIAQERVEARVLATDLSPIAIEVSAENAARLGLEERVDVRQGDLFAPLPPESRGEVDLLISNPPYVPSADVPDLPAEVAGFEPHLALDGGADGLDVYRRILDEARTWLRPGSGILAIELDERRVQHAAAEARQWYEDVRVVLDLAGRDRIVTARLAQRP
ncbi:MAG: peptide chain release factor N(5)-glutamine methyltransferase [Coriobacteriia bacterium]|nr:peptide chain release factor N(5)-glutamine methyltransferase [Coriobacteriia bacterium]